ncbi:MAG: HAD family phosphatase [Edaphobacter sp.]|uniref:HAD family hydrolase n=1 Tax=Edaphobacter sp. TaxID=1934404 RepID=UPI0023A1968F|nr:HAD family phosphatase [Edaphobacter sp.]MDE1175464.1 HAD family phosphatase [Edaphobacter sp.]
MTSNQTAPVHAILFDYGMVLSAPPDPSQWQRMLDVSGLGQQAFEHGYWAYRHAYDRGELNAADYWPRVAESAGVSFDASQIEQLIDADVELWTIPNTPMIEWAQKLQDSGIRTGILSNIGDAMTDGLLRKLEWLSGFDHHTWSYRLLLAKPEIAIYEAAARGLETPAANILFIDDKPENIAAAQASGMQAIQYTDHDLFLNQMQQRGFSHLLSASPATQERL